MHRTSTVLHLIAYNEDAAALDDFPASYCPIKSYMHSESAGWQSMPKPPGDTAIGASPFVARMEAWLRFANIPYKYVGVGDTNKAPKGQVASVEDVTTTGVAVILRLPNNVPSLVQQLKLFLF